jgi:hypothetical protein
VGVDFHVRAESRSIRRDVLLHLLVAILLAGFGSLAAAQHVGESTDVSDLPDAPQSQTSPNKTDPPSTANQKKCAPSSKSAQGPGGVTGADPDKAASVPCRQKFDFEYPFGKPPGHGQRLTSMDKLRIAASNVVDPFNLLTIGATAAISVGSNPQSHYGPGIPGFAKNAGTLLTEDMSGAFFSTFLLPSIAKQDPRYYRMPNASIPRRIGNVLIQPVWSRGDNGGHMPNYGMLIGVPLTVALANVYVPGRRRGAGTTAETSAIAVATAPIDNIVDEFLPDVAKRVSIHIVLIQRIVNHLTLTEGSS